MSNFIYCAIEINTQSSTFRNPEFQNFHKTLFLPPPTTLIGIAGAGLGLSPKRIQCFFETGIWKLGVWGRSEGIAKDLWKYETLDIKKPKSIIHKEILHSNQFILIYGTDSQTAINKISEAFLNPVYALTLGNSDSLAKVCNVQIIEETCSKNILQNCLVDGDIIKEVIENTSNNLEFSIYNTSDQITYDLPVKFYYESDYGIRNIIKRKKLSFIGKKMKLNLKKQGVIYKNEFIPVFDI